MYSDIMEIAIGRLVITSPFIANILLSTDIYETTDTKTADTNGDWIRVNPEFLVKVAGKEKRDQIELAKFILAHEVWHIALMHPFRREGRDAVAVDAAGNPVSVWNLACDGQINPTLKEDGFDPPPQSYFYPGGSEMYAEEIYDKLLKQIKSNPNVKCISYGNVSDGSSGDEETDGQGEGHAEQQAREMRVKLKVQKALDVAKATGNLPASMARLVEKSLESKIPWRELLRDAVSTIIKPDDYTWSKFNRRFLHKSMWLPGMEGTQCGPIAVAFDTSGSVGQAELEAFLGELNGIFDECNPEKIYIGFCDSAFYGWTELDDGDLPLTADQFSKYVKGGGGTAFSPVFKGAQKDNLEIDMLIYFTDLYGSDFGEEPGYQTIWVTTGSTEAPWGKVIKLEL